MILGEKMTREKWPLAKVVRLNTGDDELVRTVELKTSHSVITRPVTKLCFLEESAA